MGLDFFLGELGTARIVGTFTYFRSEFPSLALCRSVAENTSDSHFDAPVASRKYQSDFDLTVELARGTRKATIDIPAAGGNDLYGAPSQSNRYKLSKEALTSETTFASARQQLKLAASELTLAASISIVVSEDPLRGYRVQVRFVNESTNPRWNREPRLSRRINEYEEPFLFDVNLTVELGSSLLVPTRLDLEAEDFRYDNLLWVDGFNTGTEYDANSGRLRTRYAPMAYQRRVKHRAGQEDLRFGTFAADPIPQLRILAEEMDQYRADWPASTLPDPELRAAEDLDRARFGDEVQRFRTGLQLIEDDRLVRKAFSATMEVFASIWKFRDPGGKSVTWRRFQIVFILSVIAGLATRASSSHSELEIVDILWFPTGGGKTEAYLAIMLWQAFFDRLRGKKVGVTAMMRFPLRLLSLQQMQRVIEAVAQAERVRSAGS